MNRSSLNLISYEKFSGKIESISNFTTDEHHFIAHTFKWIGHFHLEISTHSSNSERKRFQQPFQIADIALAASYNQSVSILRKKSKFCWSRNQNCYRPSSGRLSQSEKRPETYIKCIQIPFESFIPSDMYRWPKKKINRKKLLKTNTQDFLPLRVFRKCPRLSNCKTTLL